MIGIVWQIDAKKINRNCYEYSCIDTGSGITLKIALIVTAQKTHASL